MMKMWRHPALWAGFRSVGGSPATVCWILSLIVLCCGCAQNSESLSPQRTRQETITPTTTDQEQGTLGSQVRLTWTQTPADEPANELPEGALASGEQEILAGLESTGAETKFAKAHARYVQINNLTITTGGTTPGITGSTTGSGSATQTPSNQSTQSPTQDVRSRVGVTAPVGIAPGGIVDQNAVANAGEGAAAADKSSTDQRVARLEAMAGKLEPLIPLLEKMLAPNKVPTTQATEQSNSATGTP